LVLMAGWGSGLAAPASSYFRVGRGRQPAIIESATAQLDVMPGIQLFLLAEISQAAFERGFLHSVR